MNLSRLLFKGRTASGEFGKEVSAGLAVVGVGLRVTDGNAKVALVEFEQSLFGGGVS